ncbi:MAG TPA: hypothetical protein VIJ00_07220, partial [Nakamurella sp.]
MSRRRHLAVLVAAAVLMAGCTGSPAPTTQAATTSTSVQTPTSDAPATDEQEPMDHSSDAAMVMSASPTVAPTAPAASASAPTAPVPAPVPVAPPPAIDVLPGMPAVPDPHNIYSEAGAGKLGPAALASKAYA